MTCSSGGNKQGDKESAASPFQSEQLGAPAPKIVAFEVPADEESHPFPNEFRSEAPAPVAKLVARVAPEKIRLPILPPPEPPRRRKRRVRRLLAPTGAERHPSRVPRMMRVRQATQPMKRTNLRRSTAAHNPHRRVISCRIARPSRRKDSIDRVKTIGPCLASQCQPRCYRSSSDADRRCL